MVEKMMFSEKTYNGMPVHFALDKKIDLVFLPGEISNIVGENILDCLPRKSLNEAQNNEGEKVQVVNFIDLYYSYIQQSENSKTIQLALWMVDNIFVYRHEALEKAKTEKATKDADRN